MLKDMAFNRNVLTSVLGTELINQTPEKHEGNTNYVEHLEDFVLRTLSVRAVFESKPNYIEDLAYLIDQIRAFEAENEDNFFLGMLEIDEGNSHRIELQEAFQRNPIPPTLAELARADFAKLPQELQDSLIRHQVLVYGMTSSTYNGGYLSLIGESARRDLSNKIDTLISQYIQGTIAEETAQYIRENAEPTYKDRKKSVWYTEVKAEMDIPPSFLREGILRRCGAIQRGGSSCT
jgi:hypothetical protein